ncbi:hypothetical protein Pyn_40344 [Prunus yedoensis var. nudiflora]|uniref:Uncharacterized protein n=1 Tax=Prunus yedoensis var. nudiflora TaxID=2094558 RepID=A0A314ZSC0_PRUYE|nr:hypothetical protein Pyn_40344 [Prunus yedoensis var. nudiflora]
MLCFFVASGTCAECFSSIPNHLRLEKGRRKAADTSCISFQRGWKQTSEWYFFSCQRAGRFIKNKSRQGNSWR